MANGNNRAATIEAKQAREKERLLAELQKMPIVQVACQRADVPRTNYYRWRQQDEEFRKAADEAMRGGEEIINDMSEAQVIALIRDKNWQAISFWLKHHHPKYGNRIQITGLVAPSEELSAEQEEIVEKALRLAALTTPDEDEPELGRKPEGPDPE